MKPASEIAEEIIEGGSCPHKPEHYVTTSYGERQCQTLLITAAIEAERAQLETEERSATLHADINRAVSDALGQGVGASWHDLGDKVAALAAKCRAMEAVVEAAKAVSEDRVIGTADERRWQKLRDALAAADAEKENQVK